MAAKKKKARTQQKAGKLASPSRRKPSRKKQARSKARAAGTKAAKKASPKRKKKAAKAAKPRIAANKVTKSRKAPKKRNVAKVAAPSAPKAKAGAGKAAATAQSKPAKPPVAKAVATPKAAPAAARSTYFLTTAISYPNGVPHIGHAYEAIATDALARFQRLDGMDVFFLTGTDEHGLKMVQTAARENRNAGRFKAMDERLNVSFDRFIRTTEPEHHHSSQVLWNRVQQAGDIYLSTYSGWYSVRDEAYYDEAETTVGEDNVRRGPQGTPVEWVDERSYFFKLSAYQERLLKLYEEQPDFIGPDSRRNLLERGPLIK